MVSIRKKQLRIVKKIGSNEARQRKLMSQKKKLTKENRTLKKQFRSLQKKARR